MMTKMHPIRWRVTWNASGRIVCDTMAAAQRIIRTLQRKGETNISLTAW